MVSGGGSRASHGQAGVVLVAQWLSMGPDDSASRKIACSDVIVNMTALTTVFPTKRMIET